MTNKGSSSSPPNQLFRLLKVTLLLLELTVLLHPLAVGISHVVLDCFLMLSECYNV